MREEQPFEAEVQQLPQRSPQLLLIGAVFLRQKREPLRAEIDQGISKDDHTALPVVEVEPDLALRRALDRDYLEAFGDAFPGVEGDDLQF